MRKAALQAIDRVQAAYPTDPALQQYWIALLLPRVVDPEPTVQSTLLELLHDRVLHKPSESSLWPALEAGLAEAPEVQRFLARAAVMLAKSGTLKKAEVSAIEAMHKVCELLVLLSPHEHFYLPLDTSRTNHRLLQQRCAAPSLRTPLRS